MENRTVAGMKGNNLSGLKTINLDKTNEQNVLGSLNGEISVSDPTHARNAQNKELDLIVSNLLDQAIAESNKPSVHSKGAVEKRETSKLESGPNYDLEFGVAAGSTDSSHRETRTQQLQDESESVKMDSTAHEVPINSIKPPTNEHGFSGVESAVTDINKSALFSEMESIDTLNEKRSGKNSLNKYALAGIIATIGILICLAAYIKYGSSGSDENMNLMGSVAQGQNTAEQFGSPIPSQDHLENIPATLTTVQTQDESAPETPSQSDTSDLIENTVLEQSSGTIDQTMGGKEALLAETDPKIHSKQNNGSELDDSATLTPNIQSAANAGGEADGDETDFDTNSIAISEPINITVSPTEITNNTLGLPIGTKSTWDSIAALVPEDVVTNIGNNKSEIILEPFDTDTLDVVKNEYKPPFLVSKVNPSYPRMAAQIRETGIVILKLDINKQGRVIKAEPIRGPIVFYEEAVRAVLQWKYRPASRNGRNADSRITISINFNIK